MTDDQLVAAYTRIVEAREPHSRAGCVTPEALRALAEQRGAEAERLRTLNHAMSCPACRRELDLLRAVRTMRPRVSRRAIPLALAASLLLVAGLVYTNRARREGDEGDRLRGGGDDVVLVAPRGAIADTRTLTLVWRRVAGATGYDVSLLADDGTPVVQLVTADTTLVLGAATPLGRDADYVWTVTARVAGDTRRSAPARFRLR